MLALAAPGTEAQGFGKNKVQYDALDWNVLETPHLRVHFYAEEESLARRITPFAESVCVEYDHRFRLKPRHHIPVLLYSAHYLFQQTNAAEGFISEGTGGLTELIKGRVLIPHTGSWARLAWVTRHELTHAYMLEKLSVVMHDHHRTSTYMPPLWFTEGIAEYCGTTWDEDAEGLLRDAVLGREARPLTHSDDITGTVLMYKEGQSFLIWLGERYGSEKVFDLLDQWWRADDFETAFRIVFGARLESLDEEWFDSLKRRYYPLVAELAGPDEIGHRLTHRGEYNLGPRALPGAKEDSLVRLCFFAAGESGIDLMISERRPGQPRRARRVLHSGQSPMFESFHLFLNRADVSHRSGLIAVTAKHDARDELFIVDPARDRVTRRFDFPTLVVLHDPSWMPGDTAVVFSAQDYSGRSDLYRVRWRSGTVLERLTDDDFDDLEPDVSPDGRWVVFASDRGGRGGRYSLFRLPLSGGAPEPVSFPSQGDDRQPVYSPDGRWIAFRSTRAGPSDLWVRRAEPDSAARRVTHLRGVATDPDWRLDGRALLFTAQDAVRFNSYVVPVAPESLPEVRETGQPPRPMPALARDLERERPYERRLGFDLVQNAVGFDPVLGGAGEGQLALSDVLGNERVLVTLSNDSERFGNFWDGFEGGVTYLNQSRRLNYGVGFFRLTELYDVELDAIRREKRLGVLGLAIYPLSKFTRIEASVVARHVTDHLLENGDIRTVDMVSNFLTWAHDNVRWSLAGPTQGLRTYLTAGYTRDLTAGDADFGTLLGEIRGYMPTLPSLVWAGRVQGQSSLGPDAQRFFLSGRAALRGYEYRVMGGQQTIVTQNELRFPLLRGLTLAIPAPWILPTVSGGAFTDAAWVWQDGVQNELGSAGLSFWVGGGFFPAIRWNYAWLTSDFHTFSRRPRTQFTLDFNY
jgi:hypothetical protein